MLNLLGEERDTRNFSNTATTQSPVAGYVMIFSGSNQRSISNSSPHGDHISNYGEVREGTGQGRVTVKGSLSFARGKVKNPPLDHPQVALRAVQRMDHGVRSALRYVRWVIQEFRIPMGFQENFSWASVIKLFNHTATTDMSKATESTVLHIPKDRCRYLVNAWPLLQSEVTEGRLINMTMELHQDGTREVLLSTQKETPDVTDLSRCSRLIEAVTLGFRFVDARKLLHREKVDLASINIGRTSLHAIGLETKRAVEQRTSTSIAVDSPTVHIIGSSSAIVHAPDLLPQLMVPG